MTEIEEVKAQIQVLQKKLSFLEELEKTKSPLEEAYKRVYGKYPVTDVTDGCWENFQAGYKSAQKDYKVGEYQPTPQTPEQVADGLKEAFREAVKQGVVSSVDKPKDDFIDKMVAELKGETLYNVIADWWDEVFCNNPTPVDRDGEYMDKNRTIMDLVESIENWLPKEQSASGSQNAYVECTVEGFNDALNKIKRKLR